MVNSRHPRFVATPFGSGRRSFTYMRAHLLPKLRCYFAEFLNHGSLKRLRILSSPTCVGFGYGHSECLTKREAFLGSMGSTSYSAPLGLEPHHFSALMASRFYPRKPAYKLEPGRPSPGWPALLRPSSSQHTQNGAGILTCFPSPTAFALGLGTD